ncbi:hypothetical protein [Pseudomonas sp. FP2300]|uniref:hypothetical protein n=1 Tax=Pseudomonas sp. FP2300 TaxID=2954090 RepID=UPI002736D192|nr:hypothetical protein [Pseudomonas sp. FP2300]WLH61052.1 hypothetical protein PSH86_20225 [Pseudomonas sp. FP2300]
MPQQEHTHARRKITLGRRRQERLTAANEFLQVIAGCGQHFFRNKGSGHDDYLSMNARGRVVWLHDDYTGARINVGKEGEWDGFSHGGTLKSLVGSLGRFVLHGPPRALWAYTPSTSGDFGNTSKARQWSKLRSA